MPDPEAPPTVGERRTWLVGACAVAVSILAGPVGARDACVERATERFAECRLAEVLSIVDECAPRLTSGAEQEAVCDLRGATYDTIEQSFRDAIDRPCRVRPVFELDETSDEALVRALLAIACGVAGRECTAQIRDARERYEQGRFDEVPSILEPCLTFYPDVRAAEACPGKGYRTPPSLESAMRAYELLAEMYVATNETEKAEAVVARLLFLDPDYHPTDPSAPRALVRATAAARDAPITPRALGIEDCAAGFSLSGLCPPRCTIPGEDLDHGPFEIGIEAGFFLPDRDLSGKPEDLDEAEPQIGIRADYLFGDHLGAFADVSYSAINSDVDDPSVEDSEALVARLGLEWLAGTHGRRLPRQWYVLFGAGWARFDLQFSPTVERPLAFAGVGQRLLLDPSGRARMRWEIRADQTLDDEGFGGRDLTSAQLLLGLSWASRRDPDRDNDGVANGLDPDPRDPGVCGDGDEDGCDDCAIGRDGLGPLPDRMPGNDGPDRDGDGRCDASDD